MPWTHPLYGPARITAAGKVISARKAATAEFDMDSALSIAGNWRSSHGYPLHVIKTLLRKRAKVYDSGALVSQRLKRLPSIITKLQRFNSMQLSTMQDLGGCRAVVRTVLRVDRLVHFYETNQPTVTALINKKDYILTPKSDGYRGVHLIYEYQGKSQGGTFRGLKIEIQIRSRLQHAWATALETIDTFTNEALKSGLGKPEWKRFFALMGTAMALREKRPVVPDTPDSLKDLIGELKPLCGRLRVVDTFQGLSAGVRLMSNEKSQGAVAHIVELDSEEKVVSVHNFASNEEATDRYMEMEKENLEKPHIQTVLVGVDSIQALRSAYPSFYLDASRFTRFIDELLSNK
jgi:hypothetical protein